MSPLSLLTQDSSSFILWILAIVYGITVHEFSHAFAAVSLGDPTPERQGRVTLNPMAHIDITGMLFLVIVGFGWGRPVEFNPHNLKHPRRDGSLIAIVGPLSNFLSAGIFALLGSMYVHATGAGPENLLIQFLILLVVINVGLGVFNLLPIPPLDGSRLLVALLPDYGAYYDFKVWLERTGPFLLLGLLIIDRVLGINIFGFLFNLIWSLSGSILTF